MALRLHCEEAHDTDLTDDEGARFLAALGKPYALVHCPQPGCEAVLAYIEPVPA